MSFYRNISQYLFITILCVKMSSVYKPLRKTLIFLDDVNEQLVVGEVPVETFKFKCFIIVISEPLHSLLFTWLDKHGV
jgi:hypothetical protein